MDHFESHAIEHQLDTLGRVPQSGNLPVNKQTAPIVDDPTRDQHSEPASPAAPLGEASAFVARLLARADQPSDVAENPLSSPTPPDPVPGEDDKHVILRRPAVGALRSSTNIPVLFVVICLAVAFASGLAVGYGVFGRHSVSAADLTLQAREPSVAARSAFSKNVGDQVSASTMLDAAPLDPALPSRETSDSPPRQSDAQFLHPGGSGNSPKAAVRSQSSQNPLTRAISETPSISDDPTVSAASPAFARLTSRQSAVIAEQRTGIASSHPPSYAASTARPSMRAENTLPSSKGPQAAATTASALPEINPGATDSRLPNVLAEGPRSPSAPLGHIDPSQLIQSVQPVYPPEAKKRHVEGTVELRVVVGTDGRVGNVSLVSGLPLFAPAAMAAAREFRYRPAMLNGQPIETVQTINMSFKLKN